METAAVFEFLKARFGDAVLGLQTQGPDPYILVDKSKLKEICRCLKTERDLSYDYLASLSGLISAIACSSSTTW